MTDSSPPNPIPPPGEPGGYAPAATKVSGGLAIAALVVGIVAFLSGWIPIWGLVAGAVAVLLGILALVKHQSKGMAITGLILGALALLTSLVTTIILIAGIGAASTNSNPVVTNPDGSSNSSGPSESPQAEESTTTVGTRESPAALGSTVEGDDWTVTVNSFTPDGNAIVAEANMFNEEPEAGSHYSIVNYTVTYTGDDSAYAAEVSLALVTETGEVSDSFDTFVALKDSMGLDELYNGGTATGSVAFLVPDNTDVTIRVTPGFFADDTFVATQ